MPSEVTDLDYPSTFCLIRQLDRDGCDAEAPILICAYAGSANVGIEQGENTVCVETDCIPALIKALRGAKKKLEEETDE